MLDMSVRSQYNHSCGFSPGGRMCFHNAVVSSWLTRRALLSAEKMMLHRLEEVAGDIRVPVNDPHPGIPICLALDVTLTCEVRKDQRIVMGDVVCDPGRFDYTLFANALHHPRQGPK